MYASWKAKGDFHLGKVENPCFKSFRKDGQRTLCYIRFVCWKNEIVEPRFWYRFKYMLNFMNNKLFTRIKESIWSEWIQKRTKVRIRTCSQTSTRSWFCSLNKNCLRNSWAAVWYTDRSTQYPLNDDAFNFFRILVSSNHPLLPSVRQWILRISYQFARLFFGPPRFSLSCRFINYYYFQYSISWHSAVRPYPFQYWYLHIKQRYCNAVNDCGLCLSLWCGCVARHCWNNTGWLVCMNALYPTAWVSRGIGCVCSGYRLEMSAG